MVVRLLIRRPECFGPALRGEGGSGLLAAIEEAIKISEDPARDGPTIKKDRRRELCVPGGHGGACGGRRTCTSSLGGQAQGCAPCTSLCCVCAPQRPGFCMHMGCVRVLKSRFWICEASSMHTHTHARARAHTPRPMMPPLPWQVRRGGGARGEPGAPGQCHHVLLRGPDRPAGALCPRDARKRLARDGGQGWAPAGGSQHPHPHPALPSPPCS